MRAEDQVACPCTRSEFGLKRGGAGRRSRAGATARRLFAIFVLAGKPSQRPPPRRPRRELVPGRFPSCGQRLPGRERERGTAVFRGVRLSAGATVRIATLSRRTGLAAGHPGDALQRHDGVQGREDGRSVGVLLRLRRVEAVHRPHLEPGELPTFRETNTAQNATSLGAPVVIA